MTENTKQEAALRNKSLNVLANINAVEGFDPHMVTACYQDTEVLNALVPPEISQRSPGTGPEPYERPDGNGRGACL